MPSHKGLAKWFKQDWVDIGSKKKGEDVKVDIPTSIISHLEFKSGALIDAFFSFE